MKLITLSAPYGAGGSHVGPALAERLGVPFLDRAIPVEVASRLEVPIDEAMRRDESAGSALSRLIRYLAPVGVAYGARPITEYDVLDEGAYRTATEDVIREHAAEGGAVILGRAAAIVLHDHPDALHVRLEGRPGARVQQAMRMDGIEREEAEAVRDRTDRARDAYTEHFYRADPTDAKLYHLVIDSTVIPLDAVVDLVEVAARAREQA